MISGILSQMDSGIFLSISIRIKMKYQVDIKAHFKEPTGNSADSLVLWVRVKRYSDIQNISEKVFFPLELILHYCNTDKVVKSITPRHSRENGSPELSEFPGFPLSRE
jgi:hypothetical protein